MKRSGQNRCKKLAKKCDLYDVGLAKTCKKLKIPLPGRGYWAKKAAGNLSKPVFIPTPLTPSVPHVPYKVLLPPQLELEIQSHRDLTVSAHKLQRHPTRCKQTRPDYNLVDAPFSEIVC